MAILKTLLLVAQILSALGVIGLVLLQHGKGADEFHLPRHTVEPAMGIGRFFSLLSGSSSSSDRHVALTLAEAPPALLPPKKRIAPLVAGVFAADPVLSGASANANANAHFWFGSAGVRTVLHHDLSHNFVCQLGGLKRWRPWRRRRYGDRHEILRGAKMTAPAMRR